MPRIPLLGVLGVSFLVLAGCRSADPGSGEISCTLVLLKTGARTDLPAEERQSAFAGHFANMERLAKERNLLVAGPYGKERHDPALRGIFVLDTADRARARELAGTDPAVQAGIFTLEFHDLATTAPLRAFLAAELEKMVQAAREGRKPAPGEGGRGYVLLQAEDGDRARSALAGRPGVLVFARLDGMRAFAILDAKDLAAARELIGPVEDRLGPFVLDEWFASGGLARLGELPSR